jgi:hypothetical protein
LAACITFGLNSNANAQPGLPSEVQPPAALTTRFRRGLLPSLTEVIFLILVIAFSFGSLAPRLLWDADIGWHIRDGQNILATHSIPRVDQFSATMSGQAWYAWEWLYDAIIGSIWNHAGLNGVVFISAAAIAASLALVFRFTLRRGSSVLFTTVLFVLCTLASSIHFLARPHVVGWLLAVIWFWILDTNSTGVGANRRLLWLPLVMLLWANLHGGFVLGFVLLAIYVLGDTAELVNTREPRQRLAVRTRVVALLAIGCVSFLASLINAYGFNLHIHVYEYLTNSFLMQHINEFRRPDLHGAPAQAFLAMIALAIIAILSARGRLRCTDWLLIGFSIVSGLYAARNLPFASMLLMMITGPLLSRKKNLTGLLMRFENARASELSPHFPVWPIVVLILGTLMCLHQGRLLGRPIMNAHFDPSRLPVQAAAALRQQGITAPIFTLDSWGGYFIYRLYPGNKVFVDDRHDFYGEKYIRDYLRVLHLESGWEGVMSAWKVNLVVMPPDAKLSRALRGLSTWKIIHSDTTAIVFERSP